MTSDLRACLLRALIARLAVDPLPVRVLPPARPGSPASGQHSGRNRA